MNKEKLDYYRKKLLKKHKEITDSYVKNKGNSKEDVRDGTEDYIDYAVNSYAKEFLLSLTEIDRKQLVLIEEALRRIKNKTFGKCLQCSQEISAKRLEAAPWAPNCIKCQELEEQGLIPAYKISKEGEEEFEFEEEIADEAEEEQGEEEDYEEGMKKYSSRKRQPREESNDDTSVKTEEE